MRGTQPLAGKPNSACRAIISDPRGSPVFHKFGSGGVVAIGTATLPTVKSRFLCGWLEPSYTPSPCKPRPCFLHPLFLDQSQAMPCPRLGCIPSSHSAELLPSSWGLVKLLSPAGLCWDWPTPGPPCDHMLPALPSGRWVLPTDRLGTANPAHWTKRLGMTALNLSGSIFFLYSIHFCHC